MVVENVDERHLAARPGHFRPTCWSSTCSCCPSRWAGCCTSAAARVNADTFVLSLPLAAGQPALALAAFVGGLSAATGMVIVEAIAVSTMVCNDLVMPLLLRWRRFAQAWRI
jgi:Na+/proline symporter